ncbi:uncharacterized protein BT62DRAFT_944739 [Guyanagaster necrorhizus]|uniref:Uncharacterized protein n=1 Tax=Guyanagaster necrorhizus TaxID=856835 RepID=A0A9P8AWG6_9AGAR|nr:uncharacterized protein BT62DRAFT_944739 [Guyanagaster necrorhizus MCA 3950]KAG7448927.1 hypothetical protein BT62DRAFT_944739 [Guyanagaster necrorhizus MCA 3950]
MFAGFHSMTQTDAELATLSLHEERDYRFTSFSASDAVTLGLSIRKRFRGSSRHVKGKGLVISIQTIAGHTLFSCTVGDLGHPDGVGDVSLDSWACLEGMVSVVRRTGHSSFYVEKSMSAMGKTPKQMGIQGDFRVNGGAFPIWLQNAPCCPIGVVACYSGSSQDDHTLVVHTVRDYLAKLMRPAGAGTTAPEAIPPMVNVPPPDVNRESNDWEHATTDYGLSEAPYSHT